MKKSAWQRGREFQMTGPNYSNDLSPGSSCPSSEHKRSEPERMIMTQTNRHYNKQTKENNLLYTSKTVVVFTDPIPLLSFPSLQQQPKNNKQTTTDQDPTPTPPPRERERDWEGERKRETNRQRDRERKREKGKKEAHVWSGAVWLVRVRRRNGNWSDFQLVPTEGVSKSMQEEKAALIKHYLGEWVSADEGKRQPKAFIDS